MEGREEFALLMSMRTGKTKATLDDFGRLWDQGKADDLLVIAPAGVYRTWVGAIEDDVGEPLASQLRVHVWSASNGQSEAARTRQDAFFAHPGPRALLINVEALSTVKRAQDAALKFASQRRCYTAVDESTTIKNHRSKRGRLVAERIGPLSKYRRILSGLLAPQSPLDVFNQFHFLKPGILGFRSFWAFKSRYAVIVRQFFGGRTFDMVTGFRDIDDIERRMAPHSYRVRLEDCYDLPPKTYAVREVQLTDDQEKAYRDMKEFATTKLASGDHVTATQVMVQMLRLHQILCGHATDEEGRVHAVGENRTQELLDLLEEHGEGKAIIWCSYDYDVQSVSKAVQKVYGEGSVARFWGGNLSTREEEEKRFKEDPSCRFMVATAAAGGRGRTWTVADLVVYYSNTGNLEHREQSEERAQGVGKSDSVLYVDLVAVRKSGAKTVDHRWLEALRGKIDMAAKINGDDWKFWVI
jgi:SNF2 family DNA or RNA helicase